MQDFIHRGLNSREGQVCAFCEINRSHTLTHKDRVKMVYSVDSLTTPNFFFGEWGAQSSGLPEELILEVFRFLDIQSLARAARSCKKLYVLSQNAQLWKYLCIRDFFHGPSTNKEKNWKQLYQTHAGMDYLTIPFPGEQGVFSLNPYKNWKPSYSPASLLREVSLVNGQDECIFSQISLLGYEDGHIAISIELSKNIREDLRVYLQSIDPSKKLVNSLFEPTQEGIKGSIYISDQDLMKKIFKVISAFNTLPEERLTLIRKVIWAENWKNITPLSEGEIQEINAARMADEKAHQPSWGIWLIGKIFSRDRLPW